MAKKTIKKYQTQSTVEKARNVVAGIKRNTPERPTSKAGYRTAITQMKIDMLNANDINYLNRKDKDSKFDPNIAETIRLAKVKGENNAKFKRAPHPSDVLGKPKYLKKSGGSIKKKK
jgi:hypothetical protein